MSKVIKCPKLQNAQNYKMPKITKCPKLQNVQVYKYISQVTTLWFFCTFDLVYNIIDKVLNIDATFHSCVYLCWG